MNPTYNKNQISHPPAAPYESQYSVLNATKKHKSSSFGAFITLGFISIGILSTLFASPGEHRYGYDDDDDDDRYEYRRGYDDDDDDDDRYKYNGYDQQTRATTTDDNTWRRTSANAGASANSIGGFSLYTLFDDEFADYDANNDNRLTAKERTAAEQARFAQSDANNNRAVSRTELSNFFKKAFTRELRADFATLDLNNNSSLSSDEVRTKMPQQFFRASDSNADNVVSEQEYIQISLQRLQQRVRANFIRVDRNNNNSLNFNEFRNFLRRAS